MNVEVNKEVRIVLSMNEDEAKWLKEVMQNPLHGQNSYDEDENDQTIRYELFTVLTNAGV